jgi:hypothetical protein
MIDLKNLRDTDPLKRLAEKQSEQEEYSPMDPPDAYSPPGGEAIPYEKMPMFLQKMMDEHDACLKELDAFEEVLMQLQKQGLKPDKQVDAGLKRFFTFWKGGNIARVNIPKRLWICWKMIISNLCNLPL